MRRTCLQEEGKAGGGRVSVGAASQGHVVALFDWPFAEHLELYSLCGVCREKVRE